MAYIAGESGDRRGRGGCPLCAIPTLADEDGLVVARGDQVYAVLNLHPYNPGHLMVVPYRHVALLDELTEEESVELMSVTQQAIRALRAMAAPHGFNVGINLGHVAGGSLADHLHQHVVPRWGGDANFITVIGQTKVIPALLAETRRLLAEVWRGGREEADGRGRRGDQGPRSQRRTGGGRTRRAAATAELAGAMLNLFARSHVSRVTNPTSGGWSAAACHPDAVTVPAPSARGSALWLIPTGHLFSGRSPSGSSRCWTCSTARWPGPAG